MRAVISAASVTPRVAFHASCPAALASAGVAFKRAVAGNIASEIFVVFRWCPAVWKLAEKGAQFEGLMGDVVFLDGQADPENADVLGCPLSREKPSPRPPGPAKRSMIGIADTVGHLTR